MNDIDNKLEILFTQTIPDMYWIEPLILDEEDYSDEFFKQLEDDNKTT